MPEALSTDPTPYRNSSSTMLDGGSLYPPTDQKVGGSPSAPGRCTPTRYPDVAASWLWELWNEPDFSYWQGTL